MSAKYIISVDQSTQGTKGNLFDEKGGLVARAYLAHKQIVNENGWVEHDPMEILANTFAVCRNVIEESGVNQTEIVGMGISNQRETVMAWDSKSGKPICNAIVWQCARAKSICDDMVAFEDKIKAKTGLNLSPYFSAPKLTWMLRNVPEVRQAAISGTLLCGTMDSWLVYNLTEEKAFKTDYSNASRTQLFNIHSLQWDEELCKLYEVSLECLPEVCMSDSVFGHTNIGGALEQLIPICGVLGDSHAALLGQNCRERGNIKATYGTGSSVMMQTGDRPVESKGGLVTSLAWGLNGKVEYVLEGNLNYTGAVIAWLKNEVGLIGADAESELLALGANPNDKAYFVPAFTGLGAPYWDSEAAGMLAGVTRTTGRAEIVKACVECIAYQITDLLLLMREDSGIPISKVRVDGGPTANKYLMQFQSDIAAAEIFVPDISELSGLGAAYAAGFSMGIYNPKTVYGHIRCKVFSNIMEPVRRKNLYSGWQLAVRQAMTHA